MNTPEQKIRDIIWLLYTQLHRAWRAFLIAKYVHQVRADHRINCAYDFFDEVEASCIESAILALSKLVVPHADSMSIEYLLNCSKRTPEAFPRTSKEAILECAARHRHELNDIASLIANIKEQRDRTIAHFDKKHVNDPATVYTHPPLNTNEIENIFRLLIRILDTYAGYLVPSEGFDLNGLTPNVTGDLEYVIGLIEKDNQRP